MPADPVVSLLPVTQADREAAADGCGSVSKAKVIRRGEMDRTVLVQAFARHRLNHRTPAPAGNVREALANCVSALCSLRKNYEQDNPLWEDVSRFITEGNAALASPTTDSSAVSGSAEGLREALNRIAFLSTNHGGWFESDSWGAYCELGDIARAHLTEGQQS